MGLLDYFHLPPDPIVSFRLDSHRPFGPGSPVSGLLVLEVPPDPKAKTQPPPPRQINTAEITFYGRAATATTRSESTGNNQTRTIYYKDEVSLFQQPRLLAQGVSVDESSPFTSRFEFVFPYGADALPFPSPYKEGRRIHGIYDAAFDQRPLPPSFELGGGNNYAIVEYNMKVVCQFEGDKVPLEVLLPAPLEFAPPSSVPLHLSQRPQLKEFVQEAEHYSSSRLTGAEKSFKHSFRDKFSSSTPSVDVVLKVTMPSSLQPGASFPIYACMEVSKPSTPEINLPVADIRIKKLEWHRLVYYRAPLDHPHSHVKEHEQSRTDETKLNTLPESQWIEPRETIPGQDKKERSWYYPATFEARVPGDACMSFHTRNIDCGYGLEVKLETELCGKEFEYKVVTDVLVVPGGGAGGGMV
ncbi:uncharacterized protein LTR77_009936 [Saxophila tyrrhenica]|uniref:Arrestin-like N-terminal domain-containing protein n=1 Tax=Saxophila tyrrhenica TaxID=1690608 RepID=A0AAV9NZV5_9PEZI|nr:hypothetical protein LTR77_009936 [Saxophila tyrrhenica]